MSQDIEKKSNFIRQIIDEDLAAGKHQAIATRFPPEPNGYLHIGHAKSICLNFGLAQDYPGRCHLRFDDTNPVTEDTEYVESIKDDVRWLGFDWGENLFFASDYFERMYELAEHLVMKGLAYVDFQPQDAIREQRGTLSEPGTESPYRNTSVDENLTQLRKMRAGEYKDGEAVLRAKIDMTSPNMLMRDPLLYRIKHAHHHRTGDDWCIYPMYDYAHCLEDAFEGITHSICTLEFENNRELYDWVIKESDVPHQPKQIEFARLSLTYTVMSKRKLLQLVKDNHVNGWDDPRMPTIAGLRRRGITPEAIRAFADVIGVAKANSTVDVSLFEFCIRDDLNQRAPRVMCVLDPLKVVITNYPEGQTEELQADYWPHDVPKTGSRAVPFGREIYVERSDYEENPPKGYYRLAPGAEVRLRYGYYITCQHAVKDADGNVVELHCTYDPETRGGTSPDNRKVKGTIHWVSAAHGVPCEIRLYDRLFAVERPDAEGDFLEFLNRDSLSISQGVIEPSVNTDDNERYQFERQGYFFRDPDSTKDALVFNRIVTLKDGWAKSVAKTEEKPAPKPPKPKVEKDTDDSKERPQKRSRSYERDKARAEEPDLAARMEAYTKLGLSDDDADLLSGERAKGDYFEAVLAHGQDAKTVAVWLVNELLPLVGDDDALSSLKMTTAAFSTLIGLVANDEVSTAAARDVLATLLASGGDPVEIVDREGLRKVSDAGALEPIILQVLKDNASEVETYRQGKTSLLGFFVGQTMKATGGTADARMVRELLQRHL
ncbi:MAG: glutamine--tRNA ligase/YqeY domain fusion protein [bacterium]